MSDQDASSVDYTYKGDATGDFDVKILITQGELIEESQHVWNIQDGSRRRTISLRAGDMLEISADLGWYMVEQIAVQTEVDGDWIEFEPVDMPEPPEAVADEPPLDIEVFRMSNAAIDQALTMREATDDAVQTDILESTYDPTVDELLDQLAPEDRAQFEAPAPKFWPVDAPQHEVPAALEDESQEVSPAFAKEAQIGAEDLLGYVNNDKSLADMGNDVFDVLAMALAAERADPILNRIKYRSQSRDLAMRAAKSVELLTSIAQAYNLELDGKTVTADPDISQWSIDRLRRLAVVIWSHTESIKRANDEKHALIKQLEEARARIVDLEKKSEDHKKKASDDEAIVEERIQLIRKSVLAANTHLQEFKSLPKFVVARIDPETKLPLRFYIDGPIIKTCKSANDCSEFVEFADARNLRASIIRGLRSKNRLDDPKKNVGIHVRARISDLSRTIVVMQVNLRAVTSRDIDE